MSAVDAAEARLAPLEETSPCLQWTLNNDAPIYVQNVRLTNDGGSHHSNWFAVPAGRIASAASVPAFTSTQRCTMPSPPQAKIVSAP